MQVLRACFLSIIHFELKRASLANMGSTADDALARRMVAVMRQRLLHGAAESEGWVLARKLSGYFKAPLTDIVYIAQHAVRCDGQPYVLADVWPDAQNRKTLWLNVAASRTRQEEQEIIVILFSDDAAAGTKMMDLTLEEAKCEADVAGGSPDDESWGDQWPSSGGKTGAC